MLISSTESIQQKVQQMLAQDNDPSSLLQHLIEIQQCYQFIPQVAIKLLQQSSGLSETCILSVISFYSFLSLKDEGRYRLLLSDNITDRMQGNQRLFDQFKSSLEHDRVSLDFTSCTGLCDQGPGLLVNGLAVNDLDHERVDQIIKLIKTAKEVEDWPDELFQIRDNVQRRDIQLNNCPESGASLQQCLQLGADETLSTLEDSGLRGRGGAGFKTASKWNMCRDQKAEKHYVVCNADEGEPGTFKDRVLLNKYAHETIEGMTICARVIEAQQGFIYLRAEYRFLLDKLNKVLDQRREQNLLGDDILGHQGFDFDIKIHLGAGAYICGEESALIESLEGKKGIPRIRPPFPVQQGYKNEPTVVNNVETFWSVTHILSQGSDWFSQIGTAQSKGTRLLSISGDCSRPGIYEYPFGTSLHEILNDCGASDAQAVQMAGAAGTTVLSKDFDRCLSFEDLATGGSFMVIGPQRQLIDMLENFATFFRHESCGFCTPCRVGCNLVEQIIKRFKTSQGSRQDLQQLQDISKIMRDTSFCGLGSSATTSFINALQQSPEIFEDLMGEDADNPVFDLEQATSEYRRITEQAK